MYKVKRSLAEYIPAVFSFWWTWVMSGVFGFVGWFASVTNNAGVPTWIWIIIGISGVFLAQFLAFNKVRVERDSLIARMPLIRGIVVSHPSGGRVCILRIKNWGKSARFTAVAKIYSPDHGETPELSLSWLNGSESLELPETGEGVLPFLSLDSEDDGTQVLNLQFHPFQLFQHGIDKFPLIKVNGQGVPYPRTCDIRVAILAEPPLLGGRWQQSYQVSLAGKPLKIEVKTPHQVFYEQLFPGAIPRVPDTPGVQLPTTSEGYPERGKDSPAD